MNEPLRVVHLAGSAQWAGGEIFLQQMAERLDRSRFRLHVICPEEGPLKREMARRDVPCEVVPLRPLGNLRPIFALRALFRKWRANIVQSHGARSNFYARLAAGGRANISTVHNALTDYPVGRFRKFLYTRMDSVTARRAGVLVFVADALRRDFLRRAPALEARCRVIRNGVDVERFDPARYSPDEIRAIQKLKPVWTLAVIGRMTPQKGHIYLLEALRRRTSLLPSFQVFLIGDGPLRPWLEEKSRQFGLRSACHFLGVRDDIPSLLSVIDVLVAPSVSEGFPYVLLEALAMKRVVVASDVNGVSELVSAGEGTLVPPRDPEKIEQALADILAHPQEARRRAAAGQERVRREFDVRQTIRRWEMLYEEVASA